MIFMTKFSQFLALLYLAYDFSSATYIHHCVHEPIVESQIVNVNTERDENVGRMIRSTRGEKMKIEMYFDPNADSALDFYFRKLVRISKTYWEEVLSVKHRPTENITFLQTDCKFKPQCGPVTIPDEHLDMTSCSGAKGVGVDADFILYVACDGSAALCSGNLSTLAYASACGFRDTYKRPLAGFTNLCPKYLKKFHRERDAIIATIKHEMLHALVFSTSLKPLSVASNKKNVTRSWWTRNGVVDHVVTLLTSPAVVDAVRLHFNCSNLEGAELENQGSGSTKLVHWEKRIFENEGMTGVGSIHNAFSNITMALLHDSGWYTVDFTMADEFLWGKNLGCEFVKESCGKWIYDRQIRNKSVYPYCIIKTPPEKPTQATKLCTNDRMSVAQCNLKNMGEVLKTQPEYQYFKQIKGVKEEDLQYYSGSLEVADYCPYPRGASVIVMHTEEQFSMLCIAENNSATGKDNMAVEYTGNASRCLRHGGSKVWSLKQCA